MYLLGWSESHYHPNYWENFKKISQWHIVSLWLATYMVPSVCTPVNVEAEIFIISLFARFLQNTIMIVTGIIVVYK